MTNGKRWWAVGVLALVAVAGMAPNAGLGGVSGQAPRAETRRRGQAPPLPQERPFGTPQGKPRLIVLVVVDQLRADYLERFAEGFGPEGFERLKREGAYFVNCHYPYANTVTGPGHATLATGATPNRHGIAANSWFDWARKRMVHAVFDDQQAVVSEPASGPQGLPAIPKLRDARDLRWAPTAPGSEKPDSSASRTCGLPANNAGSTSRLSRDSEKPAPDQTKGGSNPAKPAPDQVKPAPDQAKPTGGTPVPPKSEPSASPCNLMSSTLGDELKLARLRQGYGGQAKVYGISWKDRSAILASGKTADGAFWFDRQGGRFVTSTYYMDALPGWLGEFNRTEVDAYLGKKWTKLAYETQNSKSGTRTTPGEGKKQTARKGKQETRGSSPQAGALRLRSGQAWGLDAGAWGLDAVSERVFVELPGERQAAYYEELAYTPYANELLTQLAERLIVEEGLGADEVTDLLAVGYSANDYGGHRWGPYSEEVEDLTLRTDAELARLLKFIEQRVGRGNYWVALSADHGVAPTLEQARARGIPAKNVAARQLFETMGAALEKRWGKDEWFMPRAAGVFNRETLERHGVSLAEAARVAGEAALTVEGVAGYVSSGGSNLPKGYAEAFELSEYPGRVGDINWLLEPFALVEGERGETSHGTPHSYDTHVPLLLWGAAFRAGVYAGRVTPADLAPTLAAALRITPPAAANGRVLTEALREAAAGRRATRVTVR